MNREEAAGLERYEVLLETAAAEQVLVRTALVGKVIELGDGARLEILHPGSELNLDDRNENSVSLRIVYGVLQCC